jgi:hypothetical protein
MLTAASRGLSHVADVKEDSMQSTRRKIVAHAIIFVLVIVAMSAVSIWLGTGPVVFSP